MDLWCLTFVNGIFTSGLEDVAAGTVRVYELRCNRFDAPHTITGGFYRVDFTPEALTS